MMNRGFVLNLFKAESTNGLRTDGLKKTRTQPQSGGRAWCTFKIPAPTVGLAPWNNSWNFSTRNLMIIRWFPNLDPLLKRCFWFLSMLNQHLVASISIMRWMTTGRPQDKERWMP
jgi:hypothetical protein